MENIHKTTLLDRCKRAVEAFRGKPYSSLQMGINIKRCDQCGKEEVIHCGECERFRTNHEKGLTYCSGLPGTPAVQRDPHDYCSGAVRRKDK